MGAQVAEQIPAINLAGTDPTQPGWHRETTPLLAYPARGEPNILVIGAYSGTTAGMLIEQFPEAKFHLFEPQGWAIQALRDRFMRIPNITIHPFALGDRNGTFPMAMATSNGCTFIEGSIEYNRDPELWCDGAMVEFDEFMRREWFGNVYHASLNIEGYEYILLPHIAKFGWLDNFETIGISWHGTRWNTVVPGPFTWQGQPVPTYEDVQALLGKTHRLVLEIDNWQTWVRQ